MTDKKYRLNESKVFCMAPWVSINNNPNGDVLPCCVARDGVFGNIYTDKIEDIWNNEKYKEFRKGILEDKKSPHCERCYKEESWGSTTSYRRHWNELYFRKYDELIEQSTDPDGHLNTMKFFRWDFRFNNLCNLACVGCGPNYSSVWDDLDKKMWGTTGDSRIFSSRHNRDKFLDTIKEQTSVVDNIYFAGGEPLLHSEHYEILEELDKIGKLDKVDFMYSTNLTKLQYKDQNVTDYWRKMRLCKVLVSLDEVDPEKLYYMRYPSDLNSIMTNIKEISPVLRTPQKSWSITPTWSLLNTHRMKEIIEYFHVNNLLPESFSSSASWDIDMHTIILMYPRHLSISNAPPEWKEHLRKKLAEFEEWYTDVMIPLKTPNIRVFSQTILKGNMSKFMNALDEEANPSNNNFLEWWKRLDDARSTNFRKVFPELDWYMDSMY